MTEDKPKQQKLDIDVEEPIPPVGNNWLLGRQDEDDIPFEETEMVDKVGNRTYLIIVIYDIVDNKRRTRIAKKILGYGGKDIY